jgi:hypothetical protein
MHYISKQFHFRTIILNGFYSLNAFPIQSMCIYIHVCACIIHVYKNYLDCIKIIVNLIIYNNAFYNFSYMHPGKFNARVDVINTASGLLLDLKNNDWMIALELE